MPSSSDIDIEPELFLRQRGGGCKDEGKALSEAIVSGLTESPASLTRAATSGVWRVQRSRVRAEMKHDNNSK